MTKNKRTNRLADETSPYLLQHALNPVDWYPWGEEALARAREEDKPIFLSIGYAACHWCHVMEHESFENEEIAGILNRDFVCIKVDREERPDLDEIYMTAVMAMTGSGGWPMTVFLAPDLKPFMGGTYFPPEDRWGRIGFKRLIDRIAGLWSEEEGRGKLLQNSEALHNIVVERSAGLDTVDVTGEINGELIADAVKELRGSFDERWGGFGPPPKFPPSGAVSTLLRYHVRSGQREPLEMAVSTLDRMCGGGLYDHLAGGFHRYSTDEMWLVPHFEKMLYDNAQLASVYLEAFQVTSDPRYARIAREIFGYEMTYMTDPAGGFYSSEDADSEGGEGLFYLWTRDELEDILGRDDSRMFAAFYGIEEGGNFSSPESYHKGLNILHLRSGLSEAAKEFRLDEAELEKRLAAMRGRLLTRRDLRKRPGLDDKIITSWNALMISALARAYQVLGDEEYLRAAVHAAGFIRTSMRTSDGRLLRTHRKGRSRLHAYLEDYAFTVQAFIDLYEAGFDPAWIVSAGELAGEMIEQFRDPDAFGFTNTGALHTDLIVRTRTAHDGAIPSPQGVAARSLLRLGRLLGKTRYFDLVEQTLKAHLVPMRQAPRGHLSLLSCVDHLSHPVKEIAIVGRQDSPDTKGLLRALHSRFLPDRVIAFRDPGMDDGQELARLIPMLSGRDLVDGRAAAYVCENNTCRQPVTSPEDLTELLKLTS